MNVTVHTVSTMIEVKIKKALRELLIKRYHDNKKTCWPSEIPRLVLKLKDWRNYLHVSPYDYSGWRWMIDDDDDDYYDD